jgi:hypothetical protein
MTCRHIGLGWWSGAAMACTAALPAAAAPPPERCELFPQAEWRASTFTTSEQAQTALAVTSDGRIVVVWSSRRQQDGTSGIYAQQFTADGVAIGGEVCVNLHLPSHQAAPDIAADKVGGVIIVWQSHGQDGDGGSIMARRFDASFRGSDEVLVNVEARGEQMSPVIAGGPLGQAVVAWTSAVPGAEFERVRLRRLDPEGIPHGGEFGLPPAPDRAEQCPDVVMCADSSFAVIFAATDDRHVPCDVRLQRFDAGGEPRGAETVVSDWTALRPVEPVLCEQGHGFAAAWLDLDPASGSYQVMLRRMDGLGQPLDAMPLVMSDARSTASGAALACAPGSGRLIVAWNQRLNGEQDAFFRLVDGNGWYGGSSRLTIAQKGRQELRPASGVHRLAVRPDGSVLAAWSGDGGFGDSTSANVTLLRGHSAPGPGPAAGIDSAPGAGRDHGQMPGVRPEMIAAAGPLADDEGAASAKPHEPPTFDPRHREVGTRDMTLGPGELGFTGILNTGWNPPDVSLAVGPEHIVLMTNGAIAFFTKEGSPTFQTQLGGSGGFWGSLGTTSFVFDPEALYDELSARYFAMAAEDAGPISFALLAVSDDSNPEGPWHKYRFSTTSLAGGLFDSPNLSVGPDVVYITGDGFPSGAGGGGSYPVFIYDKASLLKGDPPTIVSALTVPTTTQSAGIPPVINDKTQALYMIEHGESAVNTVVRLIGLVDALAAPTIATHVLAVPAYGPPTDPPQQGTSIRFDTFDARFWSVAYRDGRLWATHHIGSPRVLVRWYEIALNGWPDSEAAPALVQSGTVDPGGESHTCFSAIGVDPFGNMALAFARTSVNEFISMQTAFRFRSDPAGTVRPPVTRAQSNAAYTNAPRWGDYGAVRPDPVDRRAMWADHEYALNNNWRTWVQRFALPFPAGDVSFDGVVDVADLLLLLAAWGPCPPAPGDPCAADVNADGTVDVTDLLLLLAAWR